MISEFMTEAGIEWGYANTLATFLHYNLSHIEAIVKAEQLQGKAIVYEHGKIKNYIEKTDIENLVSDFESRSEEYAAIARAIKEKNNL